MTKLPCESPKVTETLKKLWRFPQRDDLIQERRAQYAKKECL